MDNIQTIRETEVSFLGDEPRHLGQIAAAVDPDVGGGIGERVEIIERDDSVILNPDATVRDDDPTSQALAFDSRASLDRFVTALRDANIGELAGISPSELSASDGSDADAAAVANAELAELAVEPTGSVADMTAAELSDELASGDITRIRSGDTSTLNVSGEGSLVASTPRGLTRAVEAIRGGDAAGRVGNLLGSEDVAADRRESRQRRENREAARDAAESAGVDTDEFGIDALADGTIVLQDRDTGRTRAIDPATFGGLGAAIDAETSGGEFVADPADPAAGTTSGGGLGARVVAAILLLLGAIAAAVGWSG